MKNIVTLVSFLAASILTVSVTAPKGPGITTQECSKTDEHGFCVQKLVFVKNPRTRSVQADINCGAENETFFVTLPAVTQSSFYVNVSVPIPCNRECKLVDWKELD
jgi:hypothetical protein